MVCGLYLNKAVIKKMKHGVYCTEQTCKTDGQQNAALQWLVVTQALVIHSQQHCIL